LGETGLSTHQLLFLALAGLAALCAVGVVAMKSPVRSALALVANFFVLALIYFTLGAQLLGITQIMVYAGAIMVLFLFVIMLLNLGGPQSPEAPRDLKPVLAIGFGLALAGIVGTQVLLPLGPARGIMAPDEYGTPQAIGQVLFTQYAWPFIVASILLLVGIVGSILLAKRRI
jgi:NADH-quinone oxidoreductase subunit J